MKTLELKIGDKLCYVTNYFMYENETELKERIAKKQNVEIPQGIEYLHLYHIVNDIAMIRPQPKVMGDTPNGKNITALLILFNEFPEDGLKQCAIQIVQNDYFGKYLKSNGMFFEKSMQCLAINHETNQTENIELVYKVILLNKEKKVYNIEISQSL